MTLKTILDIAVIAMAMPIFYVYWPSCVKYVKKVREARRSNDARQLRELRVKTAFESLGMLVAFGMFAFVDHLIGDAPKLVRMIALFVGLHVGVAITAWGGLRTMGRRDIWTGRALRPLLTFFAIYCVFFGILSYAHIYLPR